MSSAELVFGTPITVPGDLITAKDYEPATGDLLKCIRQIAASRTPVNTSAHGTVDTNIPKELPTCDYVFVRVDKVSNPLAAKYTGAYKVLERKDKAFLLDYRVDEQGSELHDWITVDRLKPARIDDAVYRPDVVPLAPPRRGRGCLRRSKNKRK